METATIGISSPGANPVGSITKFSFIATVGAIAALTGTAFTQTVAGLAVGDVVQVICTSPPPSGMIIANSRVSAANTLEIFFSTSVAVGITLGSLNFSGVAFR